MAETNADRLKQAVTILRRDALGDRVRDVAALLEQCEPVVMNWNNRDATAVLDLLEAALRLARGIIADDERTERGLRMPISAEALEWALRLPAAVTVHDAGFDAQHNLLNLYVTVDGAPEGAVVMDPVFHRATGWPDPVQLHEIIWKGADGQPVGPSSVPPLRPALEPAEAPAPVAVDLGRCPETYPRPDGDARCAQYAGHLENEGHETEPLPAGTDDCDAIHMITWHKGDDGTPADVTTVRFDEEGE